MQFIKIAPEILVNPDFISKIERRKSKDGERILVTVDGQQLVADLTIAELNALLIGAGLSGNEQFWAG